MATDSKTIFEELRGTADEIISQLKKMIREGNARRLVIKNKDGKILFQSVLTAGLAGTALIAMIAPIASAIAVFVMYTRDIQVLVEKDADPANPSDEYEVEAEDAEVIEINDDEESDSEAEKTVGKKGKKK
jgi:hypothetical protein